MSPVRLLRNAEFDPETTKMLGEAYDGGSRLVGEEQPASVKEEIAKRIIEAARRGERDRDALVAYDCALCASGGRSGQDGGGSGSGKYRGGDE